MSFIEPVAQHSALGLEIRVLLLDPSALFLRQAEPAGEALRALADGQPRLLRLSKDTPAEGRRADGVIELVMTCHSGGTLEIYVEPHLPAPLLWVAGTTPIAGAVRSPMWKMPMV